MLSRVVQTSRFVLSARRRMAQGRVDASMGEWLRRELQGLGPCYIKIGQFLASRSDIFGPEIRVALQGLQDDVDPEPAEEVERKIRAALRGNLKSFREIETRPLACASIGQVHRGVLKDGRQVAIKVRRSGVREEISRDFDILEAMLSALELMTRADSVQETRELLAASKTWLMDELDYRKELENYRALRTSLSLESHHRVALPRFYADLCTEDMVVMTYTPSLRIRDSLLTRESKRRMAETLMATFVQALVVNGVMHGDPHEGNIGLVQVQGQEDRIVLYDMGNIIEVSRGTRARLKSMLYDVATGNADAALEKMSKIEDLFEVRDVAKTRALLLKYMNYIRTADMDIMASIAQDPELARGKLPVKFSSVVMRIVRAFGLLEGLCKQLDPDFTYEPILKKYMRSKIDGEYFVYRMLFDVRAIARSLTQTLDNHIVSIDDVS